MTQIRDVERIREILLEIKYGEEVLMREVSDSHDHYQYYLMKDSGLLEYDIKGIGDGLTCYLNVRITSFGHDFIDTFENKSNFKGAKELAKDKGQELLKLPLEMMVDFGKLYIKQQLGL
ncbi:DUF2513 domain-containing protein [Salinicoccus roseus]|uniref:DUF2513 domain-containing protein n=1 Tax=Salinicoccus roseus TaxID=45670 RepID=UPI001585CF7E|nr:DUF2513 domain-containing protein [Salinicoccus roseus]